MVLLLFLILTLQAQSLKYGHRRSHFPCLYRSSISPANRALASSSESLDLDDNVESTSTLQDANPIVRGLKILHKFSRPHTIKGTILASSMGVTRALIENPRKLSLDLIPRALLGLTALLCGNAYIVGLNQIYDVKIDEVLPKLSHWLLLNFLTSDK